MSSSFYLPFHHQKDTEPKGKKLYPTDTLEQAQSMLTAWNMIDPALHFGPLTVEALTADVQDIRALEEIIMDMLIQLIKLRNQRDEACLGAWDKVKRARAGIRGVYGDESSEYELAGGTRLNDRKSPRRMVTSKLNEETPAPEQAA